MNPHPRIPAGDLNGDNPAQLAAANAALEALQTVRYSLREMLAEVELEQGSGSFAMEKLNQSEIAKLFETKRRNRENQS